MTLQVEYSATFFPFFNSVEANEINPKLDDALSPKEENQIIHAFHQKLFAIVDAIFELGTGKTHGPKRHVMHASV